MHHLMCLVRNRQNDLVPVSILPGDILATIFLHIAAASVKNGLSRMEWIRATTHVCHRWRELALEVLGLWTDIHPALGRRWISEMLARSQGASLRVLLNEDVQATEYLSSIRSHTYRIKELRVDVTKSQSPDILSLFSTPAPSLEILHIQKPDLNDTPVPRQMFAGITPMLRRVTLNNCSVSLPSSLLANLTHLSLATSYQRFGFVGDVVVEHLVRPFGEPPHVAFDQFLDCLEAMPGLRSLRLVNCFGPELMEAHVTSVREKRPAVQLPYLRTLILSDTQLGCIAILDHIDASGILDIDVESRRAERRVAEPLHRRLLALLAGWTNAIHTRTPLQCLEVYSSRLRLLRASHDGRSYHGVVFSVFISDGLQDLQDLQDICHALPFEELTEIHLATLHKDLWSSDTWVNVFARCEQVRYLSLETPEAATVCEMLVSGTRRRNRGRMLFPALATLKIDGPLSFPPESWQPEIGMFMLPESGSEHKGAYDWLPQCLMQRQKARMPLKTLRVTAVGGSFRETWVTHVRKMMADSDGSCILEPSPLWMAPREKRRIDRPRGYAENP
ncbi:hypothetical protein DENSPDRAFT_78198 [Dentipellis sp. KUC8613]|nr:hypothetical protein DENSPDRAFT_78198 [Dentipellis sp. KUC8613]